MMLNNMDHRLSSSTSLSNCRQTSSYADKSESAKLLNRRRTEFRRLKLISNGKSVNMNGDDCVTKKRRFGKEDGIEYGGGGLKKETASPEVPVTAPSLVRESEAPVVEEYFPYHSMSVIGRRREMEDAVVVRLGFHVDEKSRKYDFYGVYDGHGGSQVAHACRDRLHKVLVTEMEVQNQKTEETNWEDLMVETFIKMDDEVNETDDVGSIGSTAVVAVVGDEEVVVANCGDSRAVLSRGGVTIPLSNDHKPDRQDELARIENSGGRVINWNGHRVLGILATSRAIGDKQLQPFVIAKPEVTVSKRDAMDEFLILGSDGLWDVISNDLACHIVRKCFDGRICRRGSRNMNGTKEEARCTPTDAAAVLTELAIARGSKDNISVIVVNLRQR